MMRSTINSALILSLLHLGDLVKVCGAVPVFTKPFPTKLALIVHFGILMNLRDFSNTEGR